MGELRIEEEPALQVSELADSSVSLTLRAWLKNENAQADKIIIGEKAKKACDAVGLEISFPQLDWYLMEDKTK
jgi:small conductance mechanosensitive channel